jgi:uncharacterized membrane protein YbhN (UPF0104 family)
VTQIPPGRQQTGGHIGQIIQLAIGIALGALAIAYLVREVRPDEVWQQISLVWPAPLALALGLQVISPVVRTRRWQAISGGSRVLPFGHALRSLLIGQALNLLLPVRVGDVTRAWVVGRQTGQGTAYALYTVLVEKALDTAALLVSLVLLAAWGPWPPWLARSGIVVSLAILVITGAALAGVWRWRRSAGREATTAHAGLRGWAVQHLLVPADALLRQLAVAAADGRLAQMAAWTVVSWGLGWATNLAVFWSLGLPLAWTAALLVLVAIYAGVVVPAPPTRVGLWHLLVALALAQYGIESRPAVASGVVLHLVVVVPALLAAAAVVWVWPSASPVAWERGGMREDGRD